MSLTDLQRRVLVAIAQNRDGRSYVAGGAALNRDWPRISDDLDIFQSAHDGFAEIVERDIAALRDAGYKVREVVRNVGMIETIVSLYDFETRIQWMEEDTRRFLPLVRDPRFGVRLHDADMAVNKVICAATRREARDIVDLVSIADGYCPLGPLIWAAPAKTTLGPGKIIEDILATARGYAPEELSTVRMEDGAEVDPERIRVRLRGALADARRFVMEHAPESLVNRLFIDRDECPVEADEDMLSSGVARAVFHSSFDDAVPTIGRDG